MVVICEVNTQSCLMHAFQRGGTESFGVRFHGTIVLFEHFALTTTGWCFKTVVFRCIFHHLSFATAQDVNIFFHNDNSQQRSIQTNNE